MVTSDHNPIDIDHKRLEFDNALDGTLGLESCFGAINAILDLEQSIACLTSQPRKRFNVEIDEIKPGIQANLTFFDPDIEYTFTNDNIRSNSKNSAFLGKRLKGKAYGIFANNKLILN